jgi:hypothetical protein
MGFGWSFYGFFAVAAVWLAIYFVWTFAIEARERRREDGDGRLADAADRHRPLPVDRAGGRGVGLLPHGKRGGLSRRRPDDRALGRRRRAGGHADQRRHLRGDARPPLPDRGQLDLDLVRPVGGVGRVGAVRGAEAPAVRCADRRRLRGQALRQRGGAHPRGGPDHPDLHDLPDRAVPGCRRDRVGHLRYRPADGDARAAGHDRVLHGPGRRAFEFVHRVPPDAHHGAGAGARAAGHPLARRRPARARGIRGVDRRAPDGLVVQRPGAVRLQHGLRSGDGGGAVRDDPVLLDARREDGPARDRDQHGHPGAHRRERHGARPRDARCLPLPAVARPGVEHHGVDGDVAAARVPVSGRDDVRDHVDGELDPAGHRRGVRPRPVQAADGPGRQRAAAPARQPDLDRGARPGAVLVRDAEVRRRAGDRRRAGEVHREFLLRAGGAGAELAPRDEGGGDLEHGGRFRRLPRVDVHRAAQLRRARHRLRGGRRGPQRADVRAGEPRDAPDAGGEPPDLLFRHRQSKNEVDNLLEQG